jgi:putative aldouronate transport system permease protein
MEGTGATWTRSLRRRAWLYLMLVLPLVYLAVFRYTPMAGLQIAFKDFIAVKGVWGSPWVGVANFRRFFRSFQFGKLIANTLSISVYSLAAGFPIPILLAISLNEARSRLLRKTVQMVTFAPYFISTVVMASLILQFLSLYDGPVNILLKALGSKPVSLMGIPGLFSTTFVWSGVWQGMGYSSIIYLAVLSTVDPQLYEAAIVDGATTLQRILRIDLPSIAPTAVTLLILSAGQVMNVGFEKVFLLQNPMNLPASEVISTYVYKIGLVSVDYSYATAIGLFNSVVNLALIAGVNAVARRLGETSLW